MYLNFMCKITRISSQMYDFLVRSMHAQALGPKLQQYPKFNLLIVFYPETFA